MLISVKIPQIFSRIFKSVAKNDYWLRHVWPSVFLSPEMEERDSYRKDILLISCFGILIKFPLRFLWGMSWRRGKGWLYKHDTYDLLWTRIAVFEISTRNTISCWIDKVTKKVHNRSFTATLYSSSPTCLGSCSRIQGDYFEYYSESVMSCINVQHHFITRGDW